MSKRFLQSVKKRNGETADFNPKKITRSVLAALGDHYDEKSALKVTSEAEHFLKKRFGYTTPTVEDVQDSVETALISHGYADAAKKYILCRHRRDEMREKNAFSNKIRGLVESYVGKQDWRVQENSNVSYSLSAMQEYISGAVLAEYTLKYNYPREISRAHRSGDIHIHDLSVGSFGGYCAGWSLGQLLFEGFNGVKGRISAKPARHLNAALGQIVNFLGTLQNEWAGAQAFSSFDTYLAPLAAADNLSYEQVKQSIQEFVFAINATSRWGNQVPFTNITFDLIPPEDMKDKPVIIGGEPSKEHTYSDFQREMDMINRAFLEVMLKGDMDGRVFTFPIPTYNITRDFKWDSEISDLLFEMTGKYGIPYFQNFVNSSLNPGDVRSMCCRLQLDIRDLKKKTGALFGSGEKTGSLGVVTINLPRIGYLASSRKEYFDRLDEMLYLSKESLEIKRKEVSRNMETGLLPWSKRYLGTLDNHFSTIGIVGMNESTLNFLKRDISTPEGKEFAREVLEHIRSALVEYQKSTGHIYNLEATPAEGTSFRLARLDKKAYPDILAAGGETPYYTNSTQLPVSFTSDIFEAVEHQQELQTLYTGGTVFHGFTGEKNISAESCKNLVRKLTELSPMPYFTITPTYSICPNDGYISGEYQTCPECSSVCEVYSRVVGYYRPVSSWNAGKQKEFSERKTYRMPKKEVEAETETPVKGRASQLALF